MVAASLCHGDGPGIADAEPFPGDAVYKGLAGGGAVKGHVADDDVVLGRKAAALLGLHHQLAAGQTLAKIVVGVALQPDGQALGQEGAEGLAAAAQTVHHIGVLLQAVAEAPGNLAAQDGAQGPVDAGDPDGFAVGLLLFEAGFKGGQQGADVHGLFQFKIKLVRRVVVHRGQAGQNAAQVNGIRPVGDPLDPGPDQVGAAHQLVHGANAQFRHDLPQLLGDEQHEIHHVFRLAGEAAPQGGILGSNAHGAGIQVAHPHHHAAHGDQGGGGEAEFLRAQDAGDGHIPAAHQLAVGFQPDPGAQTVADQGLVGFRQAQLPGEPCVVDGAFGGRAGAAVIAGNQHTACPGLGHTGGDGADTGLGNQLDGDTGIPVGVL